jgi:hypothetical protein
LLSLDQWPEPLLKFIDSSGFDYPMWSSAALTALSSGLHSCLSKSDWSCCIALSASTRNSRRVLKTNLQRSQYAVLGVLPMNRAILRFRSGIATSLQGTITESNAFLGSAVAIRYQPSAYRFPHGRGLDNCAIQRRRQAESRDNKRRDREALPRDTRWSWKMAAAPRP